MNRHAVFSIVKKYILCWDFICAVGIANLLFLFPEIFMQETVQELYKVGIEVSSINFGIFFFTYNFLVTMLDDDFVKFLDECGDNLVGKIFWDYQYVLIVAISTLVIAILFFAISLVAGVNQLLLQLTFYFFAIAFFYEIFTTLNLCLNTQRFIKQKIEFNKVK